MIYDCFVFDNELDVLECRLVELEHVPALTHVLVEAPVTFRGDPKPLWFAEHRERFGAWADRIVSVVAELPGKAAEANPWIREAAQREGIAAGLAGAVADDIVLLSDVDEIPTVTALGALGLADAVVFEQTHYCWSCQWRTVRPWRGTVAARPKTIESFQQMRDWRTAATAVSRAGWHLSWFGGADQARHKAGSFSHADLEPEILAGIDSGRYTAGVHASGERLVRSRPKERQPRWVREGRCPTSWTS